MISLYCGNSTEPWNASNLTQGIGGSEQAAIYLSRVLGKVQVFNSTEARFINGDVTYLPYEQIGEASQDTLIVWRSPENIIKLKDIKAKKKILWLHDLLKEPEVLPFIYFYDLVVVASNFHREQYPNIPDELIKVIPLGIDIPSIEAAASGKRDPWKICYFSAYDRGARVLLEDWTKLKLQFPELTLVIGYGWQTLEKLSGDRQAFDFFKGYMENLFDQEGITHLGRVSQAEVLEHMSTSQLLAYPSIWPETMCLVAAQAQACGAVPVTTPLAALNETVHFGYKKMTEPEWYQAMVEALNSPEDVEFIRSMMIPEIREAYSWEKIGTMWQEIL